MKYVYFFTGFPGFIANQLIEGLLKKNRDIEKIYVLVLPTMKEKALTKVSGLFEQYNLSDNQIEIIEGDITKEGLGIHAEIKDTLISEVTHVFHLAAIYDLAVPKTIAYRVNVTGTKNVNDWVLTLKNLYRYTYFSTAYIAGTRTGICKEDELIRPPGFKNYYEETKYEAEVLVENMKSHVPVTIIRPGIVMGHSETGETIKFDGPYFFLNFIHRLRRLPAFPLLGNPKTLINLVPVDFITEAVLYLSHSPRGEGKTYHLTDPRPYPVTEVYKMLLKEMTGKEPSWKMPLPFVRFLLSFSWVRKFLRVEKETIDYLEWMGTFDSTIAEKDLQEAGITCPDLKEQIPSMVRFYLENQNQEDYHIQVR